MDAFVDTDSIQSLRKLLGLPPNAIHIIGFKRQKDNDGLFSIPVVNGTQLGWNGTIENGDFQELADRNYDLLLNYYVDDSLLLKLMSARIKARIRVGFAKADEQLNDLLFDCQLNDFKTFASELKKYLGILKEIK